MEKSLHWLGRCNRAVVGGAVGAYKSYKRAWAALNHLGWRSIGAAVGVGAGALAGMFLQAAQRPLLPQLLPVQQKPVQQQLRPQNPPAATAAKTIRAAGQVAAAKAKTIATAVGTAGSKVAQGIQQVATHITNLSTRVATTAMSQLGWNRCEKRICKS